MLPVTCTLIVPVPFTKLWFTELDTEFVMLLLVTRDTTLALPFGLTVMPPPRMPEAGEVIVVPLTVRSWLGLPPVVVIWMWSPRFDAKVGPCTLMVSLALVPPLTRMPSLPPIAE